MFSTSEQHTRRQLLRFSQIAAPLFELSETGPSPLQQDHDPVLLQAATAAGENTFSCGHLTMPQLVDELTVGQLNDRLEAVLHGNFDLGAPPDKLPKGRNMWSCGKRTLQIVNIRKADAIFRSVITSPSLGKFILRLEDGQVRVSPATKYGPSLQWAGL